MDINSSGFISELLKRKEALLEAALAYNAVAVHIRQEVVAIDFDHGFQPGSICRIMIKEFALSSPLIQKFIRTKTLMNSVLGDVRRKDAELQRLREAHPLQELVVADYDTKEFVNFAKELGIRVDFETQYICKPIPDPRRDMEEARLKHDLESRRLIIDDPIRPKQEEELKSFHWPGEFECFFSTNLPQGQGRCGFRGGESTHGAPCRGRLDCPYFKSKEGRHGR
jgi:hypothetical protein